MTPSEELLSAYLDDELSSQERVDVERRLASDSQWRETLEKLQEVRGWVQELPAVVPSQPKSILQMLAEEKTSSAEDDVRLADHSQFSSSPSSWKWMMSLAAAGLALIGTTLWWLSDPSQEVALGSKIDTAVPEAPAMKATPPVADIQSGSRTERSAKNLNKESNEEDGSVGTKPAGNLADSSGDAPKAGFGSGNEPDRFGGSGGLSGLGGGGIGAMPAPGGIAMEAIGDANAEFAPTTVADPSAVPPTPSPKTPSPKAMASNAGIGQDASANAGTGGSRGASGGMRAVARDDSRAESADEAEVFTTTPRYLAPQRFYTEQVDEPKIASYFLVKPSVETEASSSALAADKAQPNMFSEQLNRVEPRESPSAAGGAALPEGDAVPEGGVMLERGAKPGDATVPGSGEIQGDQKQIPMGTDAGTQDAETGSLGEIVTIPAVHLQVPVEAFTDLEESASKSDWKLWPTLDSTKNLETLAARRNATQADSLPIDPASEESIERFSKAGENLWLLKISREQYEALRERWSEKRFDVSEVLDDRKLQLAQSTIALKNLSPNNLSPNNLSSAGGSPADSAPDGMRKDISTNSANQGREARSEGRADFIFIILQQR